MHLLVLSFLPTEPIPTCFLLSGRLSSRVLVLLSALCPRLKAIELGNIPETLPSLSGSSRWSLGSLSLLPTSSSSAAQTSVSVSCMSDDAKGESETQVRPVKTPLSLSFLFPLWAWLVGCCLATIVSVLLNVRLNG